MTMKIAGALLLSCIGLAACASTGPGTANSNGPTQAPSGITSSNGGGQRALGNIPNIGTNSATGVTSGPVPNTKGNSY